MASRDEITQAWRQLQKALMLEMSDMDPKILKHLSANLERNDLVVEIADAVLEDWSVAGPESIPRELFSASPRRRR
jgi:hypothetical protein